MNIHFTKNENLDRLISMLTKNGFKIYEVDCKNVHDDKSFFEATLVHLPMGDGLLHPIDPEDQWRFPANWNSFNDFLWQGITEKKDEYVAILLMQLQHIIVGSPLLFKDITECLQHVADQVIKENTIFNIPSISMQIYVVND